MREEEAKVKREVKAALDTKHEVVGEIQGVPNDTRDCWFKLTGPNCLNLEDHSKTWWDKVKVIVAECDREDTWQSLTARSDQHSTALNGLCIT